MIFRQIDEILSGQKTQTRRVCKPEDFYELDYESGPDYRIGTIAYRIGEITRTGIKTRTRWQVGRAYAVVPKRGLPTVWWQRRGNNYLTHNGTHEYLCSADPDKEPIGVPVTDLTLTKRGYQPLRIRITAIRREPLQSISEADARAEGVESIEAYRALWDSINGKTKGARWADNPLVFVLEFELVRDHA